MRTRDRVESQLSPACSPLRFCARPRLKRSDESSQDRRDMRTTVKPCTRGGDQVRIWTAIRCLCIGACLLWHERPIGRLYIERRTDEMLGIDIALLPEYRQSGIGTAILRDLLAEAARDGKPFRIHVQKFNRAQRLYERLGFTTLDDDGVYLFMEWRPDAR